MYTSIISGEDNVVSSFNGDAISVLLPLTE